MRMRVFCAMVLIFGVALATSVGYAEDFSADIVSFSSEGTFAGKIYVSAEKSRMEMPQAVTITRMDKKVTWVFMPGEKMYMEQPVDAHLAAGSTGKMDGEIERSVEGKETVNGMATTKYKVTYEVRGKSETVFQWIDETTHVPVKTAAIDESWSSEFKNIQTGPQNQELFEIPAGYNKMSFGASMMGDALGSMTE